VERNEYDEITPELIEKLKIEAMLKEDELAIETDRSLEKAGALNDPDLCEIAHKVEDFAINIETLEKQLRQTDGAENKGPDESGDR
jgi:hypothetical protein